MVHTPRVRRDGCVGHQLRGGRRSAVASEEPQVPRPGPSVITARTSSVRRDCGGDRGRIRAVPGWIEAGAAKWGVSYWWCGESNVHCGVTLHSVILATAGIQG